MKSVKLNTLTLKNFKGIKAFELKANGEETKVFGANGSGKTTLFDAFTYLLFGKDSQNKANFEIETLEDGKKIGKIDHEVEAQLNIDGRNVSLKKIYRQKWVTRRGALEAQFDGYVTLYYIDEVPCKKGEYASFIEKEFGEEELFKLLTSPTYFNEQVKWQDRRNILMRVAGEVSDDEIFSTNDKLKGLAVVMEGRKIEDFQKMQAEKKKRIKAEIESIPFRIDEIQLSIPEGSVDTGKIEKEIASLDAEMDKLKEQISNIKNGKAIQEKKAEMLRIQNQMAELKRAVEDDSRNEVYKLRTRIQEEESNRNIIANQLRNKEAAMEHNVKEVTALENGMATLRPKVIARMNETYIKPESDSCDCPTCGQALPADQVAAADEKALASFNLKKSEDVERMKGEGLRMKQQKETLEAKNAEYRTEYTEIQAKLDKVDKSLAKLSEQLKTAENDVKDVSTNMQYQELQHELSDLKESIAGLEEGAAEAVAGIEDEIGLLKQQRQGLQSELAVFANVPTLKARIADLEAQETKLAAEHGKAEEHLFLIDEFIRAKVRIMEDRINSKFKYVNFKLFRTLVNGGLEEICETTVNGVEYSRGLNNAAKINAGIDIINTLSEFHGLQAPIFLDNAEAVVEPFRSESQMIRLIVSGKDEKLRVESGEWQDQNFQLA